MPATREPLATEDEVAAYLRREPTTLKYWRSHGGGPRFIPGRYVRYDWADVYEWVEQQKRDRGTQGAA